MCKLSHSCREVLRSLACDGSLIRLSCLGLHRVEILRDGFRAGEAAGVVRTDGEDARLLFCEVNVEEMRVIVLGDPLVVAVVQLHVVAVFLLDEQAIHAEVVNHLLVGGIKNVIVDLVHPDVALLHLLLGHDAGAAGCGSARVAAALQSICVDAVRHGLARLDQRQIPVVVIIRFVFFFHVVPVGPPRAQPDLVVELVFAAFIVALDHDHVFVACRSRINDPLFACQVHVRKVAALGRQRAVFTGVRFAERDGHFGHGIVLGEVLVPEREGAGLIGTDVDVAADVPSCVVHIFIVACTLGYLPPAVPVAVPPVEHLVAGLRCVAGPFLVAAGGQGECHDQYQRKRNRLFHNYLLIIACVCCIVLPRGVARGDHQGRGEPQYSQNLPVLAPPQAGQVHWPVALAVLSRSISAGASCAAGTASLPPLRACSSAWQISSPI